MMSIYPEHATERDRWILTRRGARNQLDPFKPHAFLVEEERAESGAIVSVATIFLTNRECPWRCVMCDLWKNTLTETVPSGAIPAQIDYALAELSKQRSAGFQPASSGDIVVAGDCREQRESRDAPAVMPTRKMSLKRHSPSPRPSPPGEGEACAARSPLPSARLKLPSMMPALRQIKLYNSGSFFDPRAVPPEDHEAIAQRAATFERVIVECHPALIGESALKFRDLLSATDANGVDLPPVRELSLKKRPPSPRGENSPKQFSAPRALEPASRPLTPPLLPSEGERVPEGRVRGKLQAQGEPDSPDQVSGPRVPLRRVHTSGGGHGRAATTRLEVAMGLETAHPQVLEKLNKRMTLDQFRRAAEFLQKNDIALRVFILVKPPLLDETEALLWAKRSIDFAFDCGATVASLIPTRFVNCALETLAENGEFSPPKLATLEAALDYGVGLDRGRVFADLWDLEKFSDCPACFKQRRSRLREMNLRQVIRPRAACRLCSETGATPVVL